MSDYTEKYHRHHDLAEEISGVREDLGYAGNRIRELERVIREEIREAISTLSGELASAWMRIAELEQAMDAHRENEPHLYADGSSS